VKHASYEAPHYAVFSSLLPGLFVFILALSQVLELLTCEKYNYEICNCITFNFIVNKVLALRIVWEPHMLTYSAHQIQFVFYIGLKHGLYECIQMRIWKGSLGQRIHWLWIWKEYYEECVLKFCLLHYGASSLVGTRGSFLGGKAARAWSWPHTHTSCAEVTNMWGYKSTPPVCPNGMVLSWAEGQLYLLPSTPCSPKWPLSNRFYKKNAISSHPDSPLVTTPNSIILKIKVKGKVVPILN